MATGSGWRYFGAALVVAAIAVPATIYLSEPEPIVETRVIPAPDRHEPAPLGPGLPPTAKAEPAPQSDAAAIDPWAPSGMEVTTDKRLVVNKKMRLVFDYFLQPMNPGDRTERLKKLQTHLKNALPPTAYEEATPIILNYAKYLDALDARNATEKGQGQNGSLATSYGDIEQMKTEMAEISRLRQTILGVKLAELWFADEEVGMQQFLEHRGQAPKFAITVPKG